MFCTCNLKSYSALLQGSTTGGGMMKYLVKFISIWKPFQKLQAFFFFWYFYFFGFDRHKRENIFWSESVGVLILSNAIFYQLKSDVKKNYVHVLRQAWSNSLIFIILRDLFDFGAKEPKWITWKDLVRDLLIY